ncbi:hypothetical protein GALMADRAFT_247271 [Galerina marginata CBS 339.88]|uniref:Uncharacterized protein n=1 Tax=Galerina marginata (strain CBS 339.88) TaxID=685588 RepID=A0A067TAR4_GALM3|nr:hypothetical protein GALMADRAFT_247271 [Galerina marginata CBS 339.88]
MGIQEQRDVPPVEFVVSFMFTDAGRKLLAKGCWLGDWDAIWGTCCLVRAKECPDFVYLLRCSGSCKCCSK